MKEGLVWHLAGIMHGLVVWPGGQVMLWGCIDWSISSLPSCCIFLVCRFSLLGVVLA